MFSLIIAFVVIVVVAVAVDSPRTSRHFPNSLPTVRQPVKWVMSVKRPEIFHNHSGGGFRKHNLENQERQRTNVRALLVNNIDSLPTYLEANFKCSECAVCLLQSHTRTQLISLLYHFQVSYHFPEICVWNTSDLQTSLSPNVIIILASAVASCVLLIPLYNIFNRKSKMY